MKKRYILLLVLSVVGIVYFLGPKPKTPLYNLSIPEITIDVEEYVAQLEARSVIKPKNEAEIVWIDDSTKAPTEYSLLYLHGYTASKFEGSPVYSDFATRYQCNSFAARLASQGLISENAMIDYTAESVWESALEALAIAKKIGHKVIIMSTSTGGTLALKLAAEFPEDVFALINLSPNIHPKAWNSFLLNDPWGLQISRFVLNGDFRVLEKKDKEYEKYWYDKYRIESLVEMQQLVETTMTKETFSKVYCPVQNIYYYLNEEQNDPVVRVDKIIWMHQLLGTMPEQKVLTPIKNANTHVIGCGLYSKAIKEIEEEIYSFSENVLQLKPI